MNYYIHESVRDEKGFTLVELAIVMVIIGLLVGGILKGQEMIQNTQVTSTIAQTKSTDAAVGTFQDMYSAFPGDMANAGTRLPNCAGTCVVAGAGVGDTRLNSAPLAAAGTEAVAFYQQLTAADLVSGINAQNFLDASLNGNELVPGFSAGGALGALVNARSGHYLAIVATGTPATAGMKGLDAARIDRKLDDGLATTGSVGAGQAGCHAAGVYDEDNQGLVCTSLIRIQG